MNSLKYYLSIFLLSSVLFSCNKLDLAPTDKFTEANYWTSAEKANLVLNMAYSQMYNNDYFFKTEALSDNIYEGRGSSSEKIISSGRADASNGRFADEWKNCYEGIKTCHTLLANIDRVPNMNADSKNRMVAEARFIRAWLFFRLTTWFGDVPLFTSDISLSESQSIGRTPKADVLAFIRSELDDIAPLLPKNTEYAAADRGRITSGAAVALKARTYLYENDWANVATETEKLINSTNNGTYSLFASYSGLFLPQNEYNSEVILDIEYVPSVRTWSNFYDLAPLSVGARLNQMAPTQELVNNYIMANGKSIGETGSGYDESNPYVNRDPRLGYTVVYDGYKWQKPDGSLATINIKPGSGTEDEYVGQGSNATSTGYYLRKYYDPSALSSFTSGLNLILIRYADVLLMYAEAKNELNLMNQSVWDATIKALRQRAGFTDAGALNFNASWSQADLRNIIRQERRSELAIEGLRVFDIRRWKTAETVLNDYPHGARYGEPGVADGYIQLDKRSFNKDRDYLWAVPQSQKDLNPNLGQNPNW